MTAATPLGRAPARRTGTPREAEVLHVGVSDRPAWEVSAANTLAELRGWSPSVALEIEHSLVEGTPDRDLLPMAARSTWRSPRGLRSPPGC